MTDYIVITFNDPTVPPYIKGFKNEDNAKVYLHGAKAVYSKANYGFRYHYGDCVETIKY